MPDAETLDRPPFDTGSPQAVPAGHPAPGHSAPGHPAPGGLRRSMRLPGALLIALSAISPASSVFIIVPGVLATAGSGALLSMAAGAAIAWCLAFVFAELASAYPLSGGEYAIVGRVVGPFWGFLVMGASLIGNCLIPAVMALGLSTYLGVLLPGLPPVPTALVTIAIVTLVGILNIRTNAVLTGLFLVVEILALLVLVALGFLHVARPLTGLLLHPAMPGGTGLVPASPAMIGMATSVALFAYNGYGAAVYFGEETHDAGRHIARAVMWAFAIAIASELVPVIAILMGAPDLRALLGARNMLGDFIAARGGPILATMVSLGIALAIFNALIAMMLLAARIAYSTGRDRIWPAGLSGALTRTHRRFHSPWVATLVCGVIAGLACLVPETALLVITSSTLVLIAGLLCVAVIMGRHNGTTDHGHYRMPLFPLLPAVALLAMLSIVYTNWLDPVIGRPSLAATGAICVASALYYRLVLRRRGAWVLRGPDDC
ncbi:APC family permease [Nguyenibacter vanlangensis]|uniref:APC family permease n=1 Tax=Nguyenibacter vanlangensis TaxID=1216886 RepID=A0ABZ3D970_9PROT